MLSLPPISLSLPSIHYSRPGSSFLRHPKPPELRSRSFLRLYINFHQSLGRVNYPISISCHAVLNSHEPEWMKSSQHSSSCPRHPLPAPTSSLLRALSCCLNFRADIGCQGGQRRQLILTPQAWLILIILMISWLDSRREGVGASSILHTLPTTIDHQPMFSSDYQSYPRDFARCRFFSDS